MPGPQVKNWDQYHAIRKEGYSKESAAKIVNAHAKRSAVHKIIKKRRANGS